MRMSKLKPIITKLVLAGHPALITGPPGCGKTDMFRQIAEEIEWDFLPIIPVICDPTDAKGIPVLNKKTGLWEWQPIGDVRRILYATEPMLVLIDDFGQAPAMVQASFMQWLLLRKIGEHPIPDCVSMMAASNRRGDKCAVTGMIEAVKGRFASIYEMTPHVDDWSEWAMTHDMPDKLISAVRFLPNLLTDFVPTPDLKRGPSARNLAWVGKLSNLGIEDLESLSGAVGEGAAAELLTHFRIWNELPNLTALIADPDSAHVPTNLATLYAISTGIAAQASATNISRIFKYSKRMPQDFDILVGRDCIRRDKDMKIQQTKAFTEWILRNKNVLAA